MPNDRSAGRRDAGKLSALGPGVTVYRTTTRSPAADQLVNLEMTVRKRGAVLRDLRLLTLGPPDRFQRAFLCVGVGETVVDNRQVSAIPTLFDHAANDGFILL